MDTVEKMSFSDSVSSHRVVMMASEVSFGDKQKSCSFSFLQPGSDRREKDSLLG